VICYDIDGVLLPDLQFTDPETDVALRDRIKPYFRPRGEFMMLTGRPVSDRVNTENWLSRWDIAPVRLFHGNEDWRQHRQYKLMVLRQQPDISVLVESDAETVRYLRRAGVACEVRHFQAVLYGALQIAGT
jgi:hypothetical protein